MHWNRVSLSRIILVDFRNPTRVIWGAMALFVIAVTVLWKTFSKVSLKEILEISVLSGNPSLATAQKQKWGASLVHLWRGIFCIFTRAQNEPGQSLWKDKGRAQEPGCDSALPLCFRILCPQNPPKSRRSCPHRFSWPWVSHAGRVSTSGEMQAGGREGELQLPLCTRRYVH